VIESTIIIEYLMLPFRSVTDRVSRKRVGSIGAPAVVRA
jgi:hypothetical protein